MKIQIFSIKIQLIIFLSILGLCLSIINKDTAFLSAICISIVSAALLDSFIVYLKTRQLKITDSSVISGLIVGYVISAGEPWWKFLLASILAIGSKHSVRANARHLFNPAAFGIFLSTILFSAATQWRGATLWYVLIPVGIYFVWKIHKLELVASYFLSYLILFGSHALIHGLPLIDVLRYQNYFFIFIMLIEPKTTPTRRRGKWIFGTTIGISVFILAMIGVRFDSELASLLFLNLFVPTLNKVNSCHWDRK